MRIGVNLGALVLLAGMFSCRELPNERQRVLALPPSPDGPSIRVVVHRSRQSVVLSSTAPCRVRDIDGADVGEARRLQQTQVRLINGGVAVGDQRTGLQKLRITASEPIVVNGKPLAREVHVIAEAEAGVLHAVAVLPLERYLCGVLLGEVPVQKWHEAALKAQAVASRSYALFHMARRRGRDWDVTATQSSQVFKGGVDNPRVNRIVNATRGQVLMCDGGVIPAYFHSSCGGATEASGNVFNERTIRPLAGSPCGFCQVPDNRFASWELTLRLSEITEIVSRHASDVGQARIAGVRELEVVERGVSGRALTLRVRHAFAPFDMDAERFRQWVGPMRLPSTMFRMQSGSRSVTFRGSGWGHGIGLCQFGAEGMAANGYTYRQILNRYYPQAEISRAY
jgi:stage II sporulation protein D